MKVFLRAFETDDYLLINEWRKDPEIWVKTTGNAVFVSPEREKRWVESKILDDTKDLYCSVCLTENNKMIGYVSLTSIDRKNLNAMLGVIIGDKNYRDINYSVQSMYLIMKYAFEQMGLHKINGIWLEDHKAALYLSKSLGFKEEGLLRDHLFKNGKYNNLITGSVLYDEFIKETEKIKFDN